MLLSKKKIAGVSRILAVAIRNKASMSTIYDKLQYAILRVHSPRGGWSQKEIDIAYLVKAFGGPRLLYSLQIAEGYPSLSTLRSRKITPELIVSLRSPHESEISVNITSFLGSATGRKPPVNSKVGQVLMIDGVALEEVGRYDLKRNGVLGLCREHSQGLKLEVDTLNDLGRIKLALHEEHTCHFGKDGTVVGIAPITGSDNYFVSPIILSGSCKSEKGTDMAPWVTKLIETYAKHPDGERRHGPIQCIATDGESCFRKLRTILCRSELLPNDNPLSNILSKLPGLNLWTGPKGLLGTSDPKHFIKRCATKIRSPSGIQIGSNTIQSVDVFNALTNIHGMTEDKANLLLNPADKQNVPKAVNLLQSLFDLKEKSLANVTPTDYTRLQGIIFFATVLSFFLIPFINVHMPLSQQIQSLSTYSHLITALYRMHKSSFLTAELISDSQAIVKNIIFTVAKLQIIDLNTPYYIILEGSDRLEEVFSRARTQDHARNFDILQLALKLSIGAEINAIFERWPDLDRGHYRRNLTNARGVDHVNPASWVADVCVGNVNLEFEYKAGRDEANKLLVAQFGASKAVDWDSLFSNPDIDHLRPTGEYVGSKSEDTGENDEELGGPSMHNFLDSLNSESPEEEETAGDFRNNADADALELNDSEENELEDGSHSVWHAAEQEIINPVVVNETGITFPAAAPSKFLDYNGKSQHKLSLVPRLLESPSARKVTIRPLRARGVTIADSIQQRTALERSQRATAAGDSGKVKAGDIGAILCRVGSNITLAVVEVLSFRQSGSKDLPSFDVDELEGTGSRSVSVAVEIVQLRCMEPENAPGSSQASWITNQLYVQTIPSARDGSTTSKNFIIRVPGTIFHPLGPDIYWDSTSGSGGNDSDSEIPCWKLQECELEEIMNYA
jgi:hypothetical protein